VTRIVARLEQQVAGRVWVIFALALAIAIPTVILGEVAAHDTRQRVREAQLRDQTEAAQRVASRTTVVLGSYADVLVKAVQPQQLAAGSREAPIVTAARSRDVAAARTALADIATYFPYSGGLFLANADGIIVAGLQIGNMGTQEIMQLGQTKPSLQFLDSPRSRLGAVFMTPDELKRAFAGPAVYFSDLYEPLDRSGAPMGAGTATQAYGPGEYRSARAEIAVRILGTDGRLAGVLAADVFELPLLDAIFEIQGAADDAYILDRKGHFVKRIRIAPFDPELGRDLSGAAVVQTLIAGGTLRGEADDPLGGGRRLITSARTPNVDGNLGANFDTGWNVISVQRLDPVFASLDRDLGLLRALRLSLVVALLGFAGLLALAMRRATAQRRVLARTNEALSLASRELAAASGHKSDFLANMSHELRTPLNAIIGFSEVLEQHMFGELNARQTEYVGDISSSGKHLLNLVNDILDLSKVEAGRMDLDTTEFALSDTIEATLTYVRERAASHAIELASDVPPSLGTLVADERKIRQVLLNLLSNAVKFTPDGGWIGVTASRHGDEVQVSVRDTGIGIGLEDQPKVFEEFRQLGKPSDRSREGTGLGLALAKRFVELHGGRIWFESELTKGTTFTFALPTRAIVSVPS
jgi:signal transduction histidine kinase